MAKFVTAKAFSGNPIRNNGASIIYGQVRGNVVTNAPGRLLVGATKGVMNHPIPPNANPLMGNAIKAITAGPFATNRNGTGTYMIKGVTRTIATVANTALLWGPANRGRRSIALNEHNNTRRVSEVTFNYATGQPSATPRVTVDNFGTDTAARPSRAVPGHLLYMAGTKTPVTTKNYQARTG